MVVRHNMQFNVTFARISREIRLVSKRTAGIKATYNHQMVVVKDRLRLKMAPFSPFMDRKIYYLTNLQ